MKQKWKRFLAALLAAALLCSISGLTIFAEAPGGEPSSFEGEMFLTSGYSGGISINGFTEEYISSLTQEEKQNIPVIIPAEYNGQPVKALGEKAFATFLPKYDYYDQVNFTSLDFSGAVNLEAILNYAFYSNRGANGFQGSLVLPEGLKSTGSCAFQNCKGFTGDLVLPDSLISLGEYSFFGCTGLNGSLRLPRNPDFQVIPKQAFQDCSFTGRLEIPGTVTTIANHAFRSNKGFTGALTIPESVTAIGAAAFSGCSGFTGTLRLPSNITSIENQTFQECAGITGALTIPDAVASIGSQAFYGTSIQTVYLPDTGSSITLVNGGSAFNNCAKLTAVVSPAASYEAYKTKMTASTPKQLLSYPVTVSFAGGQAPSVERLYNRPMNLVRDASGVWGTDAGYNLPDPGTGSQAGYDRVWCFTDTGSPTQTGIKPGALVTGDTLYGAQVYSAPVITQGPGKIEKEYDGEPVKLTIQAEHPLADELLIYYDWHKINHYTGGRVQWSKDNTYTVTAPADSASGEDSWYQVTVYCYEKSTQKQFYKSGEYYFDVNITKRAAKVNPVCDTTVFIGDGLPPLSLSEGDAEGTIAWDEGQTPVLGEGSYTWSFTPANPDTDQAAAGSLHLRFIDSYEITAAAGEHGSITPSGTVDVSVGEDQTFLFVPDPGYKLASVTVDGQPAPAADSYTFRNVRAAHTIAVTFAPISVQEAQDIIENLPAIEDAQTQEELEQAAQSILDAKIQTGALQEDGKLSGESADKLNDALAQLPQIEVKVDADDGVRQDGVAVVNPNSLLSAMTAEEAQGLRDKTITQFALVLTLQQPDLTEEERLALEEALGNFQAGKSYDLSAEKQVTREDGVQTESVTQLGGKVSVAFPIPQELKAPEAYHRTFRLLRLHQNPDGTYAADMLEDTTPENPDQITVETDRFSIYSLIYADQPESYAVSFDTDGGSAVPGQTVVLGGKIARPDDPEKAGYTFSGWYADAEFTVPWDFANDTVAKETTLYAQWEKEPDIGGQEKPGTGRPSIPGGSHSDWKWPESAGGAASTTPAGGKRNPQSGGQSSVPLALVLLAGAGGTIVLLTRKRK